MSYILEALKKAQAERQLGQLPTIHAEPPQLPVAAGVAGRRSAWWPLAGGALLALSALFGLLWRQPAERADSAPAVPMRQEPDGAMAPAAANVAPPAAPPAMAERAPAAALVPAMTEPEPTLAPARIAPPPLPARSARNPAPAPEAAIPTVRQLPEAIQGQLPSLALGGYIYSNNPADRLLLIDKVLRHEGEELAPGLTLEQLQPKAAVFNYRGYRYRVPY